MNSAKEHIPHRIQHESDRGFTGVGKSEELLREWLEFYEYNYKQGDVLCLESDCGAILPSDSKGKCLNCGGSLCKPDFFCVNVGTLFNHWIPCFADGSIHEKLSVQLKDMEQNQAMMNQGRHYIRFTTKQLETWKKHKDQVVIRKNKEMAELQKQIGSLPASRFTCVKKLSKEQDKK